MSPSIPREDDSKTSALDTGVSILPKETLRGKRLVLKTPTADDDGALCSIFSDLITMKYLPQFHRPNGWTVEEISARRLQQENEFLQGKRLSLVVHVLEKTASGEEVSTIAGMTGYVFNGDGSAEFGIVIHHLFWRKGLNTEAAYVLLKYGFETLALERVDWLTRMDNAPMRGWCESLGMEAYTKLTLEMGESAGYSLSKTEWYSRVRHLLQQRLSWTDVQLS